jgi:hypothetical protein
VNAQASSSSPQHKIVQLPVAKPTAVRRSVTQINRWRFLDGARVTRDRQSVLAAQRLPLHDR